MKRIATIRAEHERYADKRNATVSAELTRDIRTSDALLKQAKAVLYFIGEGGSEQVPNMAERELIRLIADVCVMVNRKGLK